MCLYECMRVCAYFWIASSYVVSFQNQKRTLYEMKKKNTHTTISPNQPIKWQITHAVNNLTQYEKHCATYDKHTFAFSQQQIWLKWVSLCVRACVFLFLIRFGCVPFRNSKFSNTEENRGRETQTERKSHRTVSSSFWVHCVYTIFFLVCYGKMCKNSKWIQKKNTHLNQIQSVFFIHFNLLLILTGPGTLLWLSIDRAPFFRFHTQNISVFVLFCVCFFLFQFAYFYNFKDNTRRSFELLSRIRKGFVVLDDEQQFSHIIKFSTVLNECLRRAVCTRMLYMCVYDLSFHQRRNHIESEKTSSEWFKWISHHIMKFESTNKHYIYTNYYTLMCACVCVYIK